MNTIKNISATARRRRIKMQNKLRQLDLFEPVTNFLEKKNRKQLFERIRILTKKYK